MPRAVMDPRFWARRVRSNTQQMYRAVFECTPERWAAIEHRHRSVLRQHVQPADSILDVACGYGRLLELLPTFAWDEAYHGVDLAHCFIEQAIRTYPSAHFTRGEVLKVLPAFRDNAFDIAIMISFRGMIVREIGQEYWDLMDKQIRRVSSRALYLEYDDDKDGELWIKSGTPVLTEGKD